MKIPDDHLYISIGVILHNFFSSGWKEMPIQVKCQYMSPRHQGQTTCLRSLPNPN